MGDAVRFQMAEMTPAGAAKFLCDLMTTAVLSDKVETVQPVVEQFILDAMKAGAMWARDCAVAAINDMSVTPRES